jgi:hypothetical protein
MYIDMNTVKKRKNHSNSRAFSYTLLIPSVMIPFLETLKEKKNMQTILSDVLNKYSFFFETEELSSDVTVRYQPKGLRLQKVSFVPKTEDWAYLRKLSEKFKLSRSRIFVMMLHKYLEEEL